MFGNHQGPKKTTIIREFYQNPCYNGLGETWSGSQVCKKLSGCPRNHTGESYLNLLRLHILPMCVGGFFLQQENAPPHGSQVCLAFLEEEVIFSLPGWPALSPDINIIIENVEKNTNDHLQKVSINTLGKL